MSQDVGSKWSLRLVRIVDRWLVTEENAVVPAFSTSYFTKSGLTPVCAFVASAVFLHF